MKCIILMEKMRKVLEQYLFQKAICLRDLGGFQLEFVSISRVINHMICYNVSAIIGGTFICKKKPLQDLFSSVNAVIFTNRRTRFITGHVIYNPAYTYKFQLKTTLVFYLQPIPLLQYQHQ